ncbi:MAG: radical SAM protein [Candidatus Bathyarchaeota archaeon]|nr:MAG: radical SAM protein [Candidatus Bathyarchaeota archaeon]
MIIRETKARSILLKHKKIDSWFISRYGLNLYRGCAHNCIYCDGRSERYRVNGTFGEHVTVKRNAVEVLAGELDPNRRRVKLKPSYIMLGGGVGDSYQPAEQTYKLARRTLQLLTDYKWPVHILTKSTLVERDLDLIKENNRQPGAIVSFSFSSVNDEISSRFEPHVPPPSERLNTMTRFKDAGIACGMFLLPVIPFITDTPEMITETLQTAQEIDVDFVIFGSMTLKEGRQKAYFDTVLKTYYPELAPKYSEIYRDDAWGHAISEYHRSINAVFNQAARTYKIPRRIPPALYQDILWENDLVIVLLEHLDYFLQLEGKRSSFGYAAYAISKLNQPLSTMKDKLTTIKGVGEKTEQIILEILETDSSSYYKTLAR